MAYKSKFTGKQIDDYLDSIETKQDKLVDGVNIATINGQSLTNGGDVTIEAGSIISESDIAAMGFTKNTGTYSKPTNGIPVLDLESDIQNKLNKVDSLNAGMEDTDETVEDVVSLPFVSYNEQILTEEQKAQARENIDVNNKQDKVLKFENVLASSWVSDSTYADYPYRCDISCAGVTEAMYAEVTFSLEQITSENFAPICETKQEVVSIWSKENTNVTIPTIIIIV